MFENKEILQLKLEIEGLAAMIEQSQRDYVTLQDEVVGKISDLEEAIGQLQRTVEDLVEEMKESESSSEAIEDLSEEVRTVGSEIEEVAETVRKIDEKLEE